MHLKDAVALLKTIKESDFDDYLKLPAKNRYWRNQLLAEALRILIIWFFFLQFAIIFSQKRKHHVMRLTPETKRGADWLQMNNWLAEFVLDHLNESTLVGKQCL